ncbi:MAG: DUF1801 domain-containing protein [Dehalococcoidales bacterium]|nr:DUF1801 domain-containing protein [Dehalococcoidales bacterium]
MKKTPAKSVQAGAPSPGVDAYIAALPEPQRAALENLRQAIRRAAPGASEQLSYHIPTYKQNGWLVAFAAFASHLSFVVMREALVNEHAAELKGFKISGTSIHFSPEKPLPQDLVMKLVKARVRENGLNAKK